MICPWAILFSPTKRATMLRVLHPLVLQPTSGGIPGPRCFSALGCLPGRLERLPVAPYWEPPGSEKTAGVAPPAFQRRPTGVSGRTGSNDT